jgi:hypothetical protein
MQGLYQLRKTAAMKKTRSSVLSIILIPPDASGFSFPLPVSVETTKQISLALPNFHTYDQTGRIE